MKSYTVFLRGTNHHEPLEIAEIEAPSPEEACAALVASYCEVKDGRALMSRQVTALGRTSWLVRAPGGETLFVSTLMI